MRNLKRVLSLALALVMVLGMMVITTSAATYTDAEEITYTEAIDVMTGVGLYEGNPDGSLKPTEVLTREMAATIITRLMLGKTMAASLTPTQQIFSDVATDRWSAAAIEYCYNIGMIDGYNGAFDPEGELTGTAFAKLLLCAMGYDADAEGYTGTKWDANINVDAMDNGLYIKGVNIAAKLTREGAAQMILQAMDARMVEYTTAFDKATGAYVLYGPNKLAKTFQKTYFKNLEKVEGVIEAVDGKGTVLGTTKVTAKNVDWTDIGYAAYNWVVNGGKENVKTKTSISDVIITGTSLGVSTEGIADSVLTAEKINNKPNALYLASVDPEGCDVYYNGVYVGAYGSTAAAAKLAIADKVGAKIDYVDNDNQGKAEAVIVTEYTFDTVTDVVRKSVSGTVSDYYYSLTGGDVIKAANLAGVDALAKDDFITYVEYDGTCYVTVLEPTMMVLNSITRDKLNNETTKIYDLDGEDYIASQLDKASVSLGNTNIKDDIIIVLDEYGYIVYAEEYVDPDAYLYVLGNNHTDYLEGTTKTAVVFADGTSDYVYVSKVGAETDFNNAEIDKGIYSYTLDKDGNYVLTQKVLETAAVTDTLYETYDLTFNTINLTKFTKVVDLRKDTFGEVYTGYAELPDMVSGKIVYLAEAKLGYLIAGTDPLDLKASFVVFDTTINEEEVAAIVNGVPVYTYTLEKGVLVRGELVENYVLTAAQKTAIVANGVGAYNWDVDGTLTFTPFTADTITWTPENWGTLIEDNKIVTDDYTVVILNLTKGEIGDWDELVLKGDYYCYIDDSIKTDKIMYIVGDEAVDYDVAIKAYNDLIDYCAGTGDAAWTAAAVKAAKDAVKEAIEAMTVAEVAALDKAIADEFWMAVIDPIYVASKNGINAAAAVAKVGNNYYNTLADAIAAAGANDTIVLTDDLTVDAAINLGGKNLDGNGHYIIADVDVATDGTDNVILTTGGKISNVIIVGGHRGIRADLLATDLVLDNVKIVNSVRPVHIHDATAGKLVVTNSVFAGKPSVDEDVASASYINCKFQVKEGYVKGNVMDFRTATTFTNCDFESGFQFSFADLLDMGSTAEVKLVNCTVDGAAVADATYNLTTTDFAFGA